MDKRKVVALYINISPLCVVVRFTTRFWVWKIDYDIARNSIAVVEVPKHDIPLITGPANTL